MQIQKVSEGKYRIWVSAGRGPDGKRLRYSRTVHAKNEEAAKKLLKAFEKEILKDEIPLPRNMSFKQLWDLYMRDHVELSCKPSTREWYGECGKRILAVFGYMKASVIKPTQISNFFANLRDKDIEIAGLPGGLADESIRHHYRALRAVFNFGVKYKILKENPISCITMPKAKKKQIRPLYDTELPKVLNALANEPLKWQALCSLALTTGMRREELLGLKWSDIDMDNCELSIRRAIQQTEKEGLLIDDTKTESSKRKIAVPEKIISILEFWKREQKLILVKRFNRTKKLKVIEPDTLKYLERLKERINNFEDEFVWNQYDGRPMFPRSVTHYWIDFRKKYDLPHVTFHGLRHTSATISIADGADIVSVSARHGHADASTTLRIYAHALESADRQIAKKWDARISEISKWHTSGTIPHDNAK